MSEKRLEILKHFGYSFQLSKLSEACLKLGYACLKNDKEYLKRKIINVLFLIDQIVLFERWREELYKGEYFLENKIYFSIYPEREIVYNDEILETGEANDDKINSSL